MFNRFKRHNHAYGNKFIDLKCYAREFWYLYYRFHDMKSVFAFSRLPSDCRTSNRSTSPSAYLDGQYFSDRSVGRNLYTVKVFGNYTLTKIRQKLFIWISVWWVSRPNVLWWEFLPNLPETRLYLADIVSRHNNLLENAVSFSTKRRPSIVSPLSISHWCRYCPLATQRSQRKFISWHSHDFRRQRRSLPWLPVLLTWQLAHLNYATIASDHLVRSPPDPGRVSSEQRGKERWIIFWEVLSLHSSAAALSGLLSFQDSFINWCVLSAEEIHQQSSWPQF